MMMDVRYGVLGDRLKEPHWGYRQLTNHNYSRHSNRSKAALLIGFSMLLIFVSVCIDLPSMCLTGEIYKFILLID